MHERDIFLSAIEIADPAQRAAYVAQACGADSRLQAQVEALLTTHAQTSQFLESPAAATDTAFSQTIVRKPAETEDDETEQSSGEAEFRSYLQPATRAGWLGRLAHYEIESILGRGAFGIVAKAFDEKLHRVVAIKLMSPDLASTSPPRKRFLREARTAAAVTHENIVAIHGVEEEPIPYLVMEYIPGQTLQQRMDAKGPLEVPTIVRIAQQVAAGLAAAHAVNLIHRDIKPANILLVDGPMERAKISDFGLARAVDDATMTSSGMIAGTPMYMAPEQARGETLDHRADLFSLGSVLYRMASGRPPFRAANTVAVLKRVCEDTPRPLHDVLPGIPGWLETIIFKLLEKKREDRYQTAQEVADLLARCQRELEHNGQVTCVEGHSSAAAAPVAGSNASTGPVVRRKSKIAWLIGGVAIVAVLIGMELLYDVKQAPHPNSASNPGNTSSAGPSTATAAHGRPAGVPHPAIAPFDAGQAKKHQAEWAAHLKVPVEYTNSIGMKFRLIPPGEFTMGSTPAEIDEALGDVNKGSNDMREYIESEAPRHKVILTQPFYIGAHEVTQQHYAQVIGKNPSFFAKTGREREYADKVAGLDTASHPVEGVSWNDVAEFCEKLSVREKLKPFYFRSGGTVTALGGTGYRFSTEAEWEFACRAGTTTKYWSGDNEASLLGVGWMHSNCDGRTHAVGELPGNPFGLCDMHGNLWEWMQDGWDPKSYGQFQKEPVTDPSVPSTAGTMRVMRGGSWPNSAANCRASQRFAFPANFHGFFIGARVVLPVDAVKALLQERTSPEANATPPMAIVPSDATPGPLPPPPPKLDEPPLVEWLRGRKIRTVAQDGSGEFKTIQAALQALKRGEVVRVLDRGPYRERLDAAVPADSGLVSEVGTTLELSEWKLLTDARMDAWNVGHVFSGTNGFRLHGFDLAVTMTENFHDTGLDIPNPSGFVLEHCRVRMPTAEVCIGGVMGGKLGQGDPAGTKPNLVRDCWFEGSGDAQLMLTGHHFKAPSVVVERNFFNYQNTKPRHWSSHLMIWGGNDDLKYRTLAIRQNVFGSGATAGMQLNAKEIVELDISGNTLLSRQGMMVYVLPRGPVSVTQNLHARNGLLRFLERAKDGLDAAGKSWRVSHNGYAGEESPNPQEPPFPRLPTDVVSLPRFLSDDPADAQFARLAPDDPHAHGGAGGQAPSYLGAVRPGPAPQGGDWFVRLRERWVDAARGEPVKSN